MTHGLLVYFSFFALALAACSDPCTGPAPFTSGAAQAVVEPDDETLLWTRGGKVRIKRAD